MHGVACNSRIYEVNRLGELADYVWEHYYKTLPSLECPLYMDWRDRVIWGFPHNEGAVLFVQDEYQPELHWVEIAAKRFYVSVRTARNIALLASFLGATHLAVWTKNKPRLAKYWELVGFEQFDEHTWCIKVGA